MLARVAGDLVIGSTILERPIASIGGGGPLLGLAALWEFAITFDRRREIVTFDRTSLGPIRFPPVRGYGFRMGPSGPDGWFVGAVAPDGPADRAGLREGDRVIGRFQTLDLSRKEGIADLHLRVVRPDGTTSDITVVAGIVVP